MDDRETITEQLRKQWEAIIENDKEKNLTPGELIRKKRGKTSEGNWMRKIKTRTSVRKHCAVLWLLSKRGRSDTGGSVSAPS